MVRTPPLTDSEDDLRFWAATLPLEGGEEPGTLRSAPLELADPLCPGEERTPPPTLMSSMLNRELNAAMAAAAAWADWAWAGGDEW